MSETAVPAVRDTSKLDDVLLAMDVVDTLRHREQLVLTEMDAGAREAALLARLKEIYAAQGIDVPDRILKEGVQALEEKRFLYVPPKPSLGVSLAKIYITRNRWMAPVTFGVVSLAALFGAWQVGVVQPEKARAVAAQVELAETLPAELTRLHGEVSALALEEGAKLKADALLADGQRAVAAGDVRGARAARDSLAELQGDVAAIYEVRVVYGPGEARSGVFRIPDDVPGARNFYLIVEAVDPAGRLVTVPVSSEEDRRTARVTRWGQRVSEDVFNRVAADKSDDQIIQEAVIGQKRAGYLGPQYTVDTPGGAIPSNGDGMTSWINGRDALAELDTHVGRIRTSLAAALSAADGIEARRTIIQGEQAEAYRALAAIRLDVLQASGKAEFGRAGETARGLAARHAAFVAGERAALEAAAGAVAKLEHQRTDLASKYDAAVAAYESKVAETETALKQSEAYAALVDAAEEARAVTQRAHQKLILARTDREEKGAPYKQDPLFSYLWKRKFRSPEYKAPAITRFLDGWVAKLCRYDQAFLNYQRLTELPDRIAEHAAYVAGLEDKAETALVAAEERAMAEAGVEQLKTAADAIKAEILACDGAIAEAEERHRETAQRHEAALNEETGPAVEARALLETELRKASFPDLRILAAETVELEDDRIVDTLVRLRAEEMALELEASDRTRRPKVLRDDLAVMEGLRRQFKEARYDSPYALISRAAFDDMLSGLARGQTDIRDALRRLSRAVRRSEPQAHPDFGGRRRQETIGLPDIMGGVIGGVLGEILEEVFEETTKRGGGYGSGPIFPGPPKRASRSSSGSRSFPKGGGRSGGGGGRRGGGGFKTGGGF